MFIHPAAPLAAVEDAAFARAVGALLGPPLIDGNAVTTLVDGAAFFPAMLAAIRGAERSVTLETYMMWSGRVASSFVEALAERARAGVKVHVTLDWFGSRKLSRAAREHLRGNGVELALYQPPREGLWRIDQRTHRRILVVDGRIGFTGGMGFTDAWLTDGDGAGHWRDTALRLEGPVVAQLQAAFVDNWVESTGRILYGEDYFPPLPGRGDIRAQAFWSSPHEGNYNARVMYHLTIAGARRSIRLSNAYFVPDRPMLAALLAARARGVDVELLLAGPTDVRLTRWASRIRWGRLLEAGIRIFLYQPAVLHAKTLVVDDAWVSVGSINADSLSLRLLDEVGVNVLDAGVAAEHAAIFERDKAEAIEVTLGRWQGRTLGERLREWIGWVFSSRL